MDERPNPGRRAGARRRPAPGPSRARTAPGSATAGRVAAPGPPPARRRRPLRVATGLILLAAIGLLWPFAGWSWWPVVSGVGLLALLYLTRLDRLLFGWAPHVAGLVTAVLLAARSDPWAWGLALGVGVLGAGAVRWPDRRLPVIGVALVLVFGVGYGIAHYRSASQQHAEQARAATRQATGVLAIAPELLPRVLARGIATGDARTTCDLLGSPARDQLAASVGAPDCAGAVARLRGQVTDPGVYAAPRPPGAALVKSIGTAGGPGTAVLDGCRLSWPGRTDGSAPGPGLGHLTLRQYEGGDRYLITGYAPCR